MMGFPLIIGKTNFMYFTKIIKSMKFTALEKDTLQYEDHSFIMMKQIATSNYKVKFG